MTAIDIEYIEDCALPKRAVVTCLSVILDGGEALTLILSYEMVSISRPIRRRNGWLFMTWEQKDCGKKPKDADLFWDPNEMAMIFLVRVQLTPCPFQ